MKYLILSVLLMGSLKGLDCSGSRKACNPCAGRTRTPSPELNRDYYLPPSKIGWRPINEQDLKENDLKFRASFAGKGMERLEGEREEYPKPRVVVGDGGRPYRQFGHIYQELPRTSRRRSSSATTTLSDSGTDSSDGQDLDHPTTLCDRLRNSIAGICTQSQSKWVWTIPATTLQRQGSFVDDQPGLHQRSIVFDTRKRTTTSTKSSRAPK